MKTDAPRAIEIHNLLIPEYPDLSPLLAYRNPFELLLSVILSAQTTDAQVNRITPELFRRYPDAESLAAAPILELEDLVRSAGYFRTKARNIKAAAEKILKDHGGEVPGSMEALLKLPGVGRKTANVILFHVFGMPAVIVDTHFGRVVRRLGFTRETDPYRVEEELSRIVPENIRSAFSMRINLHGRRYCIARKPLCFRCPVASLCPWEPKTPS